MKKLIVLFILLFPLMAKGEDFSWIIFQPAITKHRPNTILSCEEIIGSYEGSFTDNCPGYVASGKMYLSVNNDCSFSGFSNFGIQNRGNVLSRIDSEYKGNGNTDPNGCGLFSIICNDIHDSISCNYTYTNGKTGSIPYASKVPSKTLNRLKTEMLAGTWIFSFRIIDTFSNRYFLDLNDVTESSSSPGDFNIWGNDEYANIILAGYSTGCIRSLWPMFSRLV